VWIIPSGTSEGQQKESSQDKREPHSRKQEQGIVHFSKLTGREFGSKMTEHAKHAKLKKTDNISSGNVRRGVRSDGKLLGSRSCLTGKLSRRIPRISSPSCGGLADFWPTTVHSRRGNSTTTTTSLDGAAGPSQAKESSVYLYRSLCTGHSDCTRSRGAPKFGLDRTSAEYYSAEGFGSVRFGHASTFGRTSVLFGLGFALRSAHFIACVQSPYSKN